MCIHACIFESLQLEGSYVGSSVYVQIPSVGMPKQCRHAGSGALCLSFAGLVLPPGSVFQEEQDVWTRESEQTGLGPDSFRGVQPLGGRKHDLSEHSSRLPKFPVGFWSRSGLLVVDPTRGCHLLSQE